MKRQLNFVISVVVREGKKKSLHHLLLKICTVASSPGKRRGDRNTGLEA